MANTTQPPSNDGWVRWGWNITSNFLIDSSAQLLPKPLLQALSLNGELFSTERRTTQWPDRPVDPKIVEIKENGEEKPLEPIVSKSPIEQSPGMMRTVAKIATGLFITANLPGVSATGELSYLSTIASYGTTLISSIPWTLGETLGSLSPMTKMAIGGTILGIGTLYGAYRVKKSVGTPASLTTTFPVSSTETETYERTITCSNGRRFLITVNLAKGLDEEALKKNDELWRTTVLEPLSNGSYDIRPGDELDITFTENGWTAERKYKDTETQEAAKKTRRVEPTWTHTIKAENTKQIDIITTLKEITNNPKYPKQQTIKHLEDAISIYKPKQTFFDRTAQTTPSIPGFENRNENACWLNTAMKMCLSIQEFRDAMEEETATPELRTVMEEWRGNRSLITLRDLRPTKQGLLRREAPFINGELKDVEDGFAALSSICELPTTPQFNRIKNADGNFVELDQQNILPQNISFKAPDQKQDFNELVKPSLNQPRDDGGYNCRFYTRAPKILQFTADRSNEDGSKITTKIDNVPMTYQLDKEHVDGNPSDGDLNYELMSFAVHSGTTIHGGHWTAYRRVVEFQNGERKDRFYRESDTIVQEINNVVFQKEAEKGSSFLYRQQKLNEAARPLQPILQQQQPLPAPAENGNIAPQGPEPITRRTLIQKPKPKDEAEDDLPPLDAID